MKLADSIRFLKGAVAQGSAGLLNCYFIRDGFIYAHNEYMQAGTLYEGPEGEYNLPADEIAGAIARMNSEPRITLHDDTIVVQSGRLRSTIQKVVGEAPPLANVDCEWKALPKGFVTAIKMALPFCGDNGWTASVRLTDNRIVAINNRSGIDIDFPGLVVGSAKHIATSSVEFLAAADDPIAYACTETAMLFRWQDERWARLQLLASVMPESVDKIFEGARGATPHTITNDWRLAFEDVAALSDGDIELHSAGIEARKGAGRAYVELADPTLTIRSKWSIKVLEPVVKIAAQWDPNKFPNPCPFAGSGFVGLVMGVRI